jgi:cell division protein ZapE
VTALLDLYRHQLADAGLIEDPEQIAAVERLAQVGEGLVGAGPLRVSSWLGRLRRRHRPPVRGLYLWGDVGRGKTWLLDLFFHALPFEDKRRWHFHRFMQSLHAELTGLKGVVDPMPRVAERLMDGARVVCLDELVVTDIGDAMLLAQLLRSLVDQGVTLVTTSNAEPDALYPDGIQRASFLPAIDLLKRHNNVLRLRGATDYRLRYLEQVPIYLTPLGPAAETRLAEEFGRLAPDTAERDGVLEVNGRAVRFRRRADDCAWFDFEALCGPPRSQNDYIELARCHHTVVLSDVPVLDGSVDDKARRFVHLVDEFYDRNVKLILSAAASPERLYCGERLAFEFRRTASRLEEMQSREYLGRPHRP